MFPGAGRLLVPWGADQGCRPWDIAVQRRWFQDRRNKKPRGEAGPNSQVCDVFPKAIEEMKKRGWEFMGTWRDQLKHACRSCPGAGAR